jgi:microcystin-dependent protein
MKGVTMEPFLAQIMLFGGTFEPDGWAFCDGRLLKIQDNTALFSLLGTTFGGDGRITFGLPDLRGRVPMHAGTGPGLTPRQPGDVLGSETVILSADEMPPHSHALATSSEQGDSNRAGNAFLARALIYSATGPASTALAPSSIAPTGSGAPHANMQPTLCINYIIALQGIYPPRS